jgi:hypothetical protein
MYHTALSQSEIPSKTLGPFVSADDSQDEHCDKWIMKDETDKLLSLPLRCVFHSNML